MGGMFKYDLSVPLPNLYDLVTEMRTHLESKNMYNNRSNDSDVNAENHATVILGFGHAGDSNLHLNIMTTGITETMQKNIEPYIYERTMFYNGSISAEHGLGQMKAPYLRYSQPESNIEIMRSVKQMFDPKGIMNPYKFFPEST